MLAVCFSKTVRSYNRMSYSYNYLIIANLDGLTIIHPLEITSRRSFVFAIYQHDPFVRLLYNNLIKVNCNLSVGSHRWGVSNESGSDVMG